MTHKYELKEGKPRLVGIKPKREDYNFQDIETSICNAAFREDFAAYTDQVYPMLEIPKDWKVGDDKVEGVDFRTKKRSDFYKGNYMNKCAYCNEMFSNADKLWFICEPCCNQEFAYPITKEPTDKELTEFASALSASVIQDQLTKEPVNNNDMSKIKTLATEIINKIASYDERRNFLFKVGTVYAVMEEYKNQSQPVNNTPAVELEIVFDFTQWVGENYIFHKNDIWISKESNDRYTTKELYYYYLPQPR